MGPFLFDREVDFVVQSGMATPQNIYVERMLALKMIDDINKGIVRFQKEIYWFQTMKLNNFNQYMDHKWKIRHREISIAFMRNRIEELEHKLKVLEVLYGT